MQSTDFISPREAYDQITLGLLDGNLSFITPLRKKNDMNSLVYAVNNLNKDGKLPFTVNVRDNSPYNRPDEPKFVLTMQVGSQEFVHGVNTVTEVRSVIAGAIGFCFAAAAQKTVG